MRNERLIRSFSAAVLAGAGLAATGGCSWFRHEPETQALSADQFASRRVAGRTDREAIDRPGQVIVEGVKPPAEDVPAGQQQPAQASRVQSVDDISPAVRQAVGRPSQAGPTVATTQQSSRADANPNSTPAGAPAPRTDTSGQDNTLGKVHAQGDGRPIYAHKVLAVLDNALKAEAQRYDERNFRRVAQDLIVKEIYTERNEELVFATAEKALDAREKQMADMLTAQWKQEQITNAGGSFELAKRRWADEGWDFDERLDQKYREAVSLVYLQRRIYPLINVTASDIRHYYETNKATEFTKPARARFRVIKIDPKKMRLDGGADGARQLAENLRVKAFKGDFATLARETNDEGLKLTAGLVGDDNGWLPKGSYVVDKVEDAVWKLRPGELTDVIEDKGVFYLARLEDKQDAVTLDFEDAAVQQEIDNKLRAQQLRAQQDRRQAELVKEAVFQYNPQMVEVAVDMAMQRYPAWAAAGKGAPAPATPASYNQLNK
jgi:parvulin-like peptidyl-prolyl isomerase